MADPEMDLTAPELEPDDLLRIDDPRFTDDNVAVVTGADLLFDGGYTHTYE